MSFHLPHFLAGQKKGESNRAPYARRREEKRVLAVALEAQRRKEPRAMPISLASRKEKNAGLSGAASQPVSPSRGKKKGKQASLRGRLHRQREGKKPKGTDWAMQSALRRDTFTIGVP